MIPLRERKTRAPGRQLEETSLAQATFRRTSTRQIFSRQDNKTIVIYLDSLYLNAKEIHLKCLLEQYPRDLIPNECSIKLEAKYSKLGFQRLHFSSLFLYIEFKTFPTGFYSD